MNRRPPNVLPIIGAKIEPIVDRATAIRAINAGPMDPDHDANLIARPEKENPQITGTVPNAGLAVVRIGPGWDVMATSGMANIAKTSIADRSTNRCHRSR